MHARRLYVCMLHYVCVYIRFGKIQKKKTEREREREAKKRANESKAPVATRRISPRKTGFL